MPSICLVSPSHPTSNPRLVKEADALVSAGYQVHVVAGRYFPPLDHFDEAIYRSARWRFNRVDYTGGLKITWHKLRRRLALKQIMRGKKPDVNLAMRAHHAAIPLLAAAAASVKADLYIGHCLAGLAAAGLAAESTRAKLGFDAEDFHSAETIESETNPAEIAIIAAIESHWLPRCTHLTAASPLIAAAYRERYGIPEPVTLLNVFPRNEAPLAPVMPKPGPARLYWFSQTIGPGRGLEQLMSVLARMTVSCSLHLRGLPSPGFPAALQAMARAHGFHGAIEFLPISPASEMVRMAAPYDLGLSLEQTSPRNRDLCLTNKIFTYLLAGLPVAMTPTSAQRALAPSLGQAAQLLDLDRPSEAAAQLDAWLASSSSRHSARETAWKLGATTYVWEQEQSRLLTALKASFPAS